MFVTLTATANVSQAQQAIRSAGRTGYGFTRAPDPGRLRAPVGDRLHLHRGREELGFVGAGVGGPVGSDVWRVWRNRPADGDTLGTLICVGIMSMMLFHIFTTEHRHDARHHARDGHPAVRLLRRRVVDDDLVRRSRPGAVGPHAPPRLTARERFRPPVPPSHWAHHDRPPGRPRGPLLTRVAPVGPPGTAAPVQKPAATSVGGRRRHPRLVRRRPHQPGRRAADDLSRRLRDRSAPARACTDPPRDPQRASDALAESGPVDRPRVAEITPPACPCSASTRSCGAGTFDLLAFNLGGQWPPTCSTPSTCWVPSAPDRQAHHPAGGGDRRPLRA